MTSLLSGNKFKDCKCVNKNIWSRVAHSCNWNWATVKVATVAVTQKRLLTATGKSKYSQNSMQLVCVIRSCKFRECHPSVTCSTHQIDGEGQAEQHEPEVEMKRVAEHVLMGVVEPAPSEGGPHSLAQDFQRLRAHLVLLNHRLAACTGRARTRTPPAGTALVPHRKSSPSCLTTRE